MKINNCVFRFEEISNIGGDYVLNGNKTTYNNILTNYKPESGSFNNCIVKDLDQDITSITYLNEEQVGVYYGKYAWNKPQN